MPDPWQPAAPAVREQFLGVAAARCVLFHDEKGIVFARKPPVPRNEIESWGLEHLLVYFVAAANTRIHWMTFSTVESPRPLRDVLMEAWGQGVGLRGVPDVLTVSRPMAAMMDLEPWLFSLGVRLKVAEAEDKRVGAALAYAQQQAATLPWFAQQRSPVTSVADLNQRVTKTHGWTAEYAQEGYDANAKNARSWLALPPRALPECVSVGESSALDWRPGEALWSWEATAEREAPRYWDQCETGWWLLPGLDPDTPEGAELEEEAKRHAETRNRLNTALACWPNGRADVARAAGLSSGELSAFLRASYPAFCPLMLVFLLGVCLTTDGYNSSFEGPRVYVATQPGPARKLIEGLAYAGRHAAEILTDTATPDPSWRYLITTDSCASLCIVMVARGSAASTMLDGPGEVVTMAPVRHSKLYQATVAVSARACLSTEANVTEMREFSRQWYTEFRQLGRSYG